MQSKGISHIKQWIGSFVEAFGSDWRFWEISIGFRLSVQPSFQFRSPFTTYNDFHVGILLQMNLQFGVEPVVNAQDTVYMNDVLAVGTEKGIGIELGFQLVKEIRHSLGCTVFQIQERIAFFQSDVADVFFTCTDR